MAVCPIFRTQFAFGMENEQGSVSAHMRVLKEAECDVDEVLFDHEAALGLDLNEFVALGAQLVGVPWSHGLPLKIVCMQSGDAQMVILRGYVAVFDAESKVLLRNYLVRVYDML